MHVLVCAHVLACVRANVRDLVSHARMLPVCDIKCTVFFGRRYVSGIPGIGSEATFVQMTSNPFNEQSVEVSITCGTGSVNNATADLGHGDPALGYHKQCY